MGGNVMINMTPTIKTEYDPSGSMKRKRDDEFDMSWAYLFIDKRK